MNDLTAISGVILALFFACIVATAVVGILRSGADDEVTSRSPSRIGATRAGHKKAGIVTAPPRRGQQPARGLQPLGSQAPRRGLLRKRDPQAALLPPDATVSFAAEREAADIDEIFEAL